MNLCDLTGANLTAYLLRTIKNSVIRHPRFKGALGDVVFTSNNAVMFNDVQVQVGTVSSQGNRLSPDYFMATQLGQTICAKLEDKEGAFIEWVREINPKLFDPGVYYLNVDTLNEQTQEMDVTIHKYRWREGTTTRCVGSVVHLDYSLDGMSIRPTLSSVLYEAHPHYLELLSPVESLSLTNTLTDTLLVPNVDFWYERVYSAVFCTTTGGEEFYPLPTNLISYILVDDYDFALKEGTDYTVQNGCIWFTAWTPPNWKINIVGVKRYDPTTSTGYHPENVIRVPLEEGETMETSQFFIRSTQGNLNTSNITTLSNGTVVLNSLMGIGDSYKWEARIDCGQTTQTVRKSMFFDSIVPGTWVAFGDKVVVNDQCVIIVSPSRCATYEIYGSKDSITFTLDVKANDLITASEIAEMLRVDMLIRDKDIMETDGLSIFEISMDAQGSPKDNSGVTATYSVKMNVSAMADWRFYKPLVTRVTEIQVEDTPAYAILPRFTSLSMSQFVTYYA